MADPQEVTESYRMIYEADLEAVVNSTPAPFVVPDVLKEAREAEFLEKVNERVSAMAEDPGADLATVIGSQEASMFLAGYQKRTLYCSKTRVGRWARAFDHKKQITGAEGILVKQFPGIGVKVEEEFLMNLITGDEG